MGACLFERAIELVLLVVPLCLLFGEFRFGHLRKGRRRFGEKVRGSHLTREGRLRGCSVEGELEVAV